MMNIKLFHELMEQAPAQHPAEWLMFLEICDGYLKKHRISNPIVVELGILDNKQKPFYEKLFGAKHIGIDISDERSKPDIMGDTHDPKTLEALKHRLGKRPINILFIDASHTYASVKQDYNMYSPLVDDIVAFHDIETGRYANNKNDGAWKYWDELRRAQYRESKRDDTYISIHQRHIKGVKARALGIGMIIKR